MTEKRIDDDYNASRSKAAFEKFRERMDDLPPDRVERITVDLDDAALTAMAMAAVVSDPGVRRMFELLPVEIFKIRHLDDLGELIAAYVYAVMETRASKSTVTEAKLGVDLVANGTGLRGRMLRLVEYYLGDDPDTGPEVAAIRSETGYVDLASDLMRLARLYEEHVEIIRTDAKLYRETDAGAANEVSAEIMRVLSEGGKEDYKNWLNMRARAWTLLHESYDEVRAAGLFIYRNDPLLKKFPSIFSRRR